MKKAAARIEYFALAEIGAWPKNPKSHDIPGIVASYERFGFVSPIVRDETSGRIVAGHGRWEALVRMKAEGKPVPKGVQVKKGEWMAPVLCGISFENEAEAQAYLLADNFLSEKGGWDHAALIAMLETVKPSGFQGTGFDDKELRRLIAKHAGATPLAGEDDPAGKPQKAFAKRGGVYQLGPHRIVCGNATHAKDVTKLLAGATPALMVTDPPYGVNYDPQWRARAGVNKAKRKMGTVANDDRADWSEAWALFHGAVAYVWHGGLHAGEVQQSLQQSGFETRSQIIWAKDRFALSRGHYHWQHEPCWYAVRSGSDAKWNGSRNQDTLWIESGPGSFSDQMRQASMKEDWQEIARIAQELDSALQTTVWTIPAREDAGHGHGTQKPVECMRRPIVNHTSSGESVYDPFLGSGTTLIAAESTGRVCYGMEIDPACVDMAIERYEKLTGIKAKKG